MAAGRAYVVSVLNIALDKVLLEMIGIKHEPGSCILNCFVPHGDIPELFGQEDAYHESTFSSRSPLLHSREV